MRFSRFRDYDAHAAANAVLDCCNGRDENNLFMNTCLGKLGEENGELDLALKQEKRTELVAEGTSWDNQFDGAFTEMRNLCRMKAEIPSLGVEAEASAEIYNSMITLGNGNDIEDLPRHAQLEAADKFIGQYETENGTTRVAQAKVVPLFKEVKKYHSELKSVEEQRAALRVDDRQIDSISDTTKKVTPLLRIIYKHVEEFANIGNSDYQAILAELDAKLAPISAQVKARETRNSND